MRADRQTEAEHIRVLLEESSREVRELRALLRCAREARRQLRALLLEVQSDETEAAYGAE